MINYLSFFLDVYKMIDCKLDVPSQPILPLCCFLLGYFITILKMKSGFHLMCRMQRQISILIPGMCHSCRNMLQDRHALLHASLTAARGSCICRALKEQVERALVSVVQDAELSQLSLLSGPQCASLEKESKRLSRKHCIFLGFLSSFEIFK